ncbi:helicase [Limosilactobacillus fermentum]|uniref:DEAD/DEAH box helicase n=1 Tax=Limosilactobacillus fermentum TaxID=1613 RepID=UPI000DC02AA1|nr:DEAD/DEAH box helicase [Limosilactobacillus fermentum]RAM09504.1 helicase [Limosilactobacillus fermentum]
MEKNGKKLGEYLYEHLENNEYLRKLMEILSLQYAFWLFNGDWKLTNKKKYDLLKFADLLSKSISSQENNHQKNIALRIVAILSKMYPNDPRVGLITNEVLTRFNNFLPRKKQGYSVIPTIDYLWNDVLKEYQKDKRQIPGQKNQSFIGKQDVIFKSLASQLNSFSAPTSMGKTFLIEKYIEFKVMTDSVENFAITVPSKALITEVKSRLIDDLGTKLSENHYRVISHPEEFQSDYEGNFIFVMTPERLSALIFQKPEVRLAYLFIDESQKATEMSSRSIFYYEIFDQIKEWNNLPNITFASPLVPNPGVFKQLVEANKKDEGLQITESPVTQVKIIFDRYAKEILIYDDLNKKATTIDKFTGTPSVSEIVLGMLKIQKGSKCNLIYYGSKKNAISDAVVVGRQLPELNDAKLNELADYISRKIHPKYILVDLIRKGIAFHTGELPINVRIRIEEACREGLLKLVFCTSTLLEGVNLPADNIFVTTLHNGKGKLSRLDFLNLIGRVGRLGHSMIGNVFLITGESEKSHSNREAYLSMLAGKLNKAKLSVTVIKPKQAAAIKKSLEQGNVRLEDLKEHRNYDLIRKLSLLYVKELKDNRSSVVREYLAKSINPDEEKKILQTLQNRYSDMLEDDINFSSDQSEKLREKISQEDVRAYPDIYKGEKLNLSETKDFLLKLSEIFDWDIYESGFIKSKEDKEIQEKIVEDDAKLTLLWISGYSLRKICDLAIKIRDPKSGDTGFLNRVSRYNDEIPNITWDTITINAVMNRLQKLQFVLGKYFLKFTQELTKSGLAPQNDWYKFLEYGTDSNLRIWLQQNGYSRESSEYIEEHKGELIIEEFDGWKLTNLIQSVDDIDVVNETKEVRINVPEIFLS